MKKSTLIKHLQSNLEKYGDGEITVEVTDNLNFEGKFYQIEDVINTSCSHDGDYDSLLVHTSTEFIRS